MPATTHILQAAACLAEAVAAQAGEIGRYYNEGTLPPPVLRERFESLCYVRALLVNLLGKEPSVTEAQVRRGLMPLAESHPAVFAKVTQRLLQHRLWLEAAALPLQSPPTPPWECPPYQEVA